MVCALSEYISSYAAQPFENRPVLPLSFSGPAGLLALNWLLQSSLCQVYMEATDEVQAGQRGRSLA